MDVKNGCSRKVFLIGKYAIKVPQFSYEWRHFLWGLLGNMQERHFSEMKDERMCPVLFCSWGGWLLIMPRCKKLTEEEFEKLDSDYFDSEYDHKIGDFTKCRVPVENKIDSFGWYKNKIVAIDYGY